MSRLDRALGIARSLVYHAIPLRQRSLRRLYRTFLRVIFGRSPRVTIVESAVTDRPGRQTLWVSERNPTLATNNQQTPSTACSVSRGLGNRS